MGNQIVEQTQVVPLNLTQESVVEVPEVVNVDLTRQRAKTVVQQNAKVVTTQNNVVNNITQEVAQTAIKEQVVAVDRVEHVQLIKEVPQSVLCMWTRWCLFLRR